MSLPFALIGALAKAGVAGGAAGSLGKIGKGVEMIGGIQKARGGAAPAQQPDVTAPALPQRQPVGSVPMVAPPAEDLNSLAQLLRRY